MSSFLPTDILIFKVIWLAIYCNFNILLLTFVLIWLGIYCNFDIHLLILKRSYLQSEWYVIFSFLQWSWWLFPFHLLPFSTCFPFCLLPISPTVSLNIFPILPNVSFHLLQFHSFPTLFPIFVYVPFYLPYLAYFPFCQLLISNTVSFCICSFPAILHFAYFPFHLQSFSIFPILPTVSFCLLLFHFPFCFPCLSPSHFTYFII